MAGPPGLWSELSEELQTAFGWAAAIDVVDVGTRGLLAGIVRAGGREAEALLDEMDVPGDALLEALHDVSRAPFEPHARVPRELKALPPDMTVHLVELLRRAQALRDERDPGGAITTRHVLEAVFAMPRSTAYRGLERVLGERMPVVEGKLRAADSHPTQAPPAVRAVAFTLSADGDRIATVDERGTVRVSRPDGSDLQVLDSGVQGATAIALAPATDIVAWGSNDGTVRIWRLPANTIERRFVGGAVALAFAPEGQELASMRADGSLVVDAQVVGRLNDVDGSAIAWPRPGRLVAATRRGEVWWFGLGPDAGRRLREPDAEPASAVALSGDGCWLALAHGGAVRVVEIASGRTSSVDAPPGNVTALALSGDGAVLAGDTDGAIWTRELRGDPPREDRVEWLADAPARADLLGRRQLARALAKRLSRVCEPDRDGRPADSFLLHVDGPWGAGKSTVLDFLREELGGEWLVVRFDAWRQSRVGPPWWALLTTLRRAMTAGLGPRARAWLRAREALDRLRQDRTSLPPFALLLVAAALVFAVTRPAPEEVRDAASLLSAIVAGFTVLWGMGRIVSRFLMWESAAGARRYEQSHQNPMESLASHFAWLVEHAPRPVVFFVDDLDRCDGQYVVDLLDSIQTLVRDTSGRAGRRGRQPPHFVVAADGRWIRRSYEETYASFQEVVGEPGRPLGYLFLDKIFQLTVDVPEIGAAQQETYLRSLLTARDGAMPEHPSGAIADASRIARSETQEEILEIVRQASPEARGELTAAAIDKLSDPAVERATEHELQRFAGLLERNPRSMKRFVNAYSMALSTSLLEGRDVEPDALALWTILRLRWPGLADHLRRRPDDADALAEDGTPPGLPEELAGLVARPDVRGLMRFDARSLTSAAVRDLTGGSQPVP